MAQPSPRVSTSIPPTISYQSAQSMYTPMCSSCKETGPKIVTHPNLPTTPPSYTCLLSKTQGPPRYNTTLLLYHEARMSTYSCLTSRIISRRCPNVLQNTSHIAPVPRKRRAYLYTTDHSVCPSLRCTSSSLGPNLPS